MKAKGYTTIADFQGKLRDESPTAAPSACVSGRAGAPPREHVAPEHVAAANAAAATAFARHAELAQLKTTIKPGEPPGDAAGGEPARKPAE